VAPTANLQLQALAIVFLLCFNRTTVHNSLESEHISADASQVKI
jgi:hypothetical protein